MLVSENREDGTPVPPAEAPARSRTGQGRALFAVVMEAWVHGVSTRKVDDLVAALGVGTGISNGDLLRGVRYFAEGARTHSILLCARCNRVRFIDSIHLFSRDRHAEIRL